MHRSQTSPDSLVTDRRVAGGGLVKGRSRAGEAHCRYRTMHGRRSSDRGSASECRRIPARTRSGPGPARSSSAPWNAPGQTARQTVPGSGSPDRPGGPPPPSRPNGMLPGSRTVGRRRSARRPKFSSSRVSRCLPRAGGNGRVRRPGSARRNTPVQRNTPVRRWCCAASATGGLPGDREEASATASTVRKPGVAIDPRLFRLFGVERVPAVVVAPGGVPPCRSAWLRRRTRAPPHDLVAGNIGLVGGARSRRGRGRPSGRDVAKADARTPEWGGRAVTERAERFARSHRGGARPRRARAGLGC